MMYRNRARVLRQDSATGEVEMKEGTNKPLHKVLVKLREIDGSAVDATIKLERMKERAEEVAERRAERARRSAERQKEPERNDGDGGGAAAAAAKPAGLGFKTAATPVGGPVPKFNIGGSKVASPFKKVDGLEVLLGVAAAGGRVEMHGLQVGLLCHPLRQRACGGMAV